MIENKRIETAEQSAAEEQIQAEIIFREELIEEAVRKELGLSKTDKITASMLENVRKLRIVGKEILDDEDTFWGEGRHVDGKDSSFGSVRGNITDLSDLAQMVNLEELALCNQKIEDISGLKDAAFEKLYLSKNMITDFSVLLNLDRSGYPLYYGESGRESVSDWRMHRHFKIKYTGDESDRYRLSEKSELDYLDRVIWK